ncbi:hypothetical protein QJV03_03415 [Listeria swaminathanii]|uniref:Tetratricopeptide repeat protein n=1 Tax=Listeria swaminathanii TaxID=2713501 RepID=A0ABU2ICR0_9LIST|nr:hypothetical protein [Listeria swaminathanii]MDT0016232.1 hypothetical protein [Listeria swaminathanii]MDT0021668.1 hypothetical protein [Listeria swaminathanii]MDT0032632.1 hypothetical protein [Listeria swaminathanii]MDT0051518.1 hypothetical protein [Listeria swaminathanii]MDT0054283.1 hypothetical protein [Listeria swaminathanii]
MDYFNEKKTVLRMADTPEKIKALERIITSADAHNDVEIGRWARDFLIDVCLTVGFPKKQLQAFSWLISKWEGEDNDVYIDTEDLLWKYKWVSEHVPTFDEVSKAQIDGLLDDMRVKFEQENYSLRPYYKVCTLAAMRMGDVKKAKELFEKWSNTKEDVLNDCTVCERQDQLHYYYFVKDYEAAKKKAKPIIEGKQRCAEVPHLTYGIMALTYLALGDAEMAQQCFDKGYPLVEQQSSLIPPLGQLLRYLVATNQTEKAREVIDTNLETVLQAEGGLDRLIFLQAAYPLFDREKEADLVEMTEALTAKFDARNENSYYQDCLNAY